MKRAKKAAGDAPAPAKKAKKGVSEATRVARLAAFDAAAFGGDEGGDDDDAPGAPPAAPPSGAERRAARLDAQRAVAGAAAAAEAADAAAPAAPPPGGDDDGPYELPTPAALAAEARGAPDLAAVRRRVLDVARVLGRGAFAKLRAPGAARADYLQQLTADLETYYG